MTIAASTNTPMEIAIPESDMMLEEMPSSFIMMKAMRVARGRTMQMISALRKCHITTTIARLATSDSCSKASVTVSMAL